MTLGPKPIGHTKLVDIARVEKQVRWVHNFNSVIGIGYSWLMPASLESQSKCSLPSSIPRIRSRTNDPNWTLASCPTLNRELLFDMKYRM